MTQSMTLHVEKGEPCTVCRKPVTMAVRISGFPDVPDIDRWACENCSPLVMHPEPGSLSFGPRPSTDTRRNVRR